MSLVTYEIHGPAAVLTLNRPDRRNALSRALISELDAAVQRANADSVVRVLILTGAGPVFCAGMDLAELQESLGDDPAATPVWNDALTLGQLYQRIYTSPKPSIAAVNGAAVAGGAGLVSVCDLAVCAPAAQFGYPEVRRGLVAALVLPHLMRHVGERMARWLLLTGELIDAATAERTGFVNAVSQDVLATAHCWALLLAEGGPQALAQTRALLGQFSHQALSLEETAKASAAPRLTEECRQGLEAFFAKRPVPWSPQAKIV
ncbi:MAG: enoyl-CoA hydratase-related protein [Gemmataceae bacterium]